ncbi:MAG: M56 family metallopeptidase [Oscillospiraceae bacterium]|nr:M56 family metallopeptidase [Oscillospiraceae bacterium]
MNAGFKIFLSMSLSGGLLVLVLLLGKQFLKNKISRQWQYYIWLVVVLRRMIRKITIYQGFVRYIKAGLAPVSDIERLDRLAAVSERAGVKRPVELCVNPLVSPPLLLGFFHPCIVLPGVDISEKDFDYIVLHELTHYKRLDIFYKWMVQVTVCLHWFNPLVHLMSREIFSGHCTA